MLVGNTGNNVSDYAADQFAKNIAGQNIKAAVDAVTPVPRPKVVYPAYSGAYSAPIVAPTYVSKPVVEDWDDKQDDFDNEDVEMGGMFGGDDDDY